MTFLAQRLQEIPRLLKEITVCLVTLSAHSFILLQSAAPHAPARVLGHVRQDRHSLCPQELVVTKPLVSATQALLSTWNSPGLVLDSCAKEGMARTLSWDLLPKNTAHSLTEMFYFKKASMDWRQKERVAEEEMVGWHHRLNGHELGWTLGENEGQGGLACYSPWGCKKSDTTEQLNNNKGSTW